MVSIRESLSELEKACRQRQAVLECYSAALQSMAQYAIEIDEEITPAYRAHLKELLRSLSGEPGVDVLVNSRTLLRNELRDYRDRAAEALKALRLELSGKADALQSIVEAMVSADGDHENRLQAALAALKRLAASPHVSAVQGPLASIASQIEASIQELKAQNNLTVSQFLVEVKTLHRRIESLETGIRKDSNTGVWSRVEMEAQVAAMVQKERAFCLIFFRISNLLAVVRHQGQNVRREALSAFSKRLVAAAPAGAVVGRWCEDQFVTLVEAAKPDVIGLAKNIVQHVSAEYLCVEGGTAHKVKLLVNSAVIEHLGEAGYESLVSRINNI
jgi:GGDEF domain-containing protein